MSNRSGHGPSMRDTFMEGARAVSEFIDLKSRSAAIRGGTPDGNGKPVIVLPGFGMGDYSTADLRSFLAGKNYKAYGWGKGMNTGPNVQTLAHLKEHLEMVYAENGRRKVALIGHSLGGIYARELAREFPGMVEQAITLGTPFGADQDRYVSMPALRLIFEAVNPGSRFLHDEALIRRGIAPPPVPATSVYSPHDGVVNWKACLNPRGAVCENVEVAGSHVGLVINPAVFLVVADRLAQDIAAGWKPFDSAAYPAFSGLVKDVAAYRAPLPPADTAWRQAAPLFRAPGNP